MISLKFPVSHRRKGKPTGFVKKILNGTKIHTIRANYDLWLKRIKEVRDGDAELSLRYWSGLPYRSKQIEFKRLTSEDLVGVQKLTFRGGFTIFPQIHEGDMIMDIHPKLLARNDGLIYNNWVSWFSQNNYDRSKPFAIIHFTGFRY